MIMHCKQGDVQVKLLDVAYVPGVQLNLFSLRAVMPKCFVSLDAEGVHIFCWYIIRTRILLYR